MAVTIEQIRLIYTTDQTDDQLQAALDTANLVVTEQLRPNCQMSESRYDMITKFLAAHFASMSRDYGSGDAGPLKSQKIGQATETFATRGDEDYAYNGTPWGQQAIALDMCGILAGVGANKGLKAELRVVGGSKS